MENYTLSFYRDFGEEAFHRILVQTSREKAIQAARNHKRRVSDVKFFEVYIGSTPVYHSIFGSWDDPRNA